MEYTIEEQKCYLKENLEIESLRKFDSTKDELQNFNQATRGDNISNYLKTSAWDDDCNHNTKVFLIRDRETRQIVFYFSLNCGILYEELNHFSLSDSERKVFENYVNILQKQKKCIENEKEQKKLDEEMGAAYGDIWEAVGEADRVSRLISMAEEKVNILEEKREIAEKTQDKDHVKPVQETFPAIDIKFLCRNGNYKPKIKLDFKLGVYVFWEIIVPHILEISKLVACKYVYLFAADRTENEVKDLSLPLWKPGYEKDELDENDEPDVRKLVSYYINELKFEIISKYTILKPNFERTCFTLVQEVSKLEENREMVWQSHMLDVESNYRSDPPHTKR